MMTSVGLFVHFNLLVFEKEAGKYKLCVTNLSGNLSAPNLLFLFFSVFYYFLGRKSQNYSRLPHTDVYRPHRIRHTPDK